MTRKLAMLIALAIPAFAWPQAGSADRSTPQTTERKDASAQPKAPFEGKHNFDVDGKVAKVEKDKLTITRDGMPEATLDVAPTTKVELDGDKASLSQLTPGQDVKASFNLQGDKPLAVEVKAKRTDAQKDMKKANQDQRKEQRKDQGSAAPANR